MSQDEQTDVSPAAPRRAPSRAELSAQLDELDAMIPRLREEYDCHGDLMECFAAHADPILDAAAPDDCDFVHERIDRILASHRLGAGDA